MVKIDDTAGVQHELARLMRHVQHTEAPSRTRLASELRSLADRIADVGLEPTADPDESVSLVGTFQTIKGMAVMAQRAAEAGRFKAATNYLALIALEMDTVLSSVDKNMGLGFKLHAILHRIQAGEFANLAPGYQSF